MKTLEELGNYLTEKLNENQQAIEGCQENIEKATQAITKAENELMAAENEVDVEAYNKAKNDIWTAKHSEELYMKQKEKLSAKPLITNAEYNKLLAEITQIANATHEDQNDQAAALIAELKKIADESSSTWQRANELMHSLQREVYREPQGKIPLSSGGTTWSTDKEYRNYETVHSFYQSKVQGSSLAKRSGEQLEQPKLRNWL